MTEEEDVSDRLPISEIKRFARECLENEEIVSFIKKYAKNNNEDFFTLSLQRFASEYVEKMGMPIKRQYNYRVSLDIIEGIYTGVFDGVDDPYIDEFLKNSPFIDWSSKK